MLYCFYKNAKSLQTNIGDLDFSKEKGNILQSESISTLKDLSYLIDRIKSALSELTLMHKS